MNIEVKSWLCWLGVIFTIVVIHDIVKSTLSYDINPFLVGGLSCAVFLPLFQKHFKKTLTQESQS